ncbi:hypothetical protein Ancab_014105, partial [Ancistrocladus abbreviatus]
DSPNRKGPSLVWTTGGSRRNAEEVVTGGGLDNPNRLADSPERTPEVQRAQDAIEDPVIAEDDPNRRESSPVGTLVGSNWNAEEDAGGGGLDIPIRIVTTPERMTEAQLEQLSTEFLFFSQGSTHQKHAKTRWDMDATCRRILEAEVHTYKDRVGVGDSQVINMNRLNGTTCPPNQSEQHLTPHQIWDFVEHIGVRGNTTLEDVVRRIGDMEQRDWEAFQQFASVGKQNEAGKGASCAHDNCVS